MAGNPITWRNINAPSFAGVQGGVAAAGQSIGQGFDRLAQAAQTVNTNMVNQETAEKKAATDRLLTMIQSTNQLDQLDPLRQTIDAELKNGSTADSKAVYAALNGRTGTIRNDINSQQLFEDNQLSRNEKPLINEAMALAEKDPAAARDMIFNSDIRNKAGLLENIETEQRSDKQYTDQQDEITRVKQERKELASIQDITLQAAMQTDDPATARAGFIERARSVGISEGGILKGLQNLEAQFNTVNGLTSSQRTQLERGAEASMSNYERSKAKRDRNLQESLKQYPVDTVFSFSDENRISQGDGIEAILQADTDVDDSDLSKDIEKNVLPDLRKALGISESDEIPGIIFLEALKNTGVDKEVIGNDFYVTVPRIKTAALAVARDYVKSQKYAAKRAELINANDELDREEFNQAQSYFSTQLGKFKQANKDLKNLIRN